MSSPLSWLPLPPDTYGTSLDGGSCGNHCRLWDATLPLCSSAPCLQRQKTSGLWDTGTRCGLMMATVHTLLLLQASI